MFAQLRASLTPSVAIPRETASDATVSESDSQAYAAALVATMGLFPMIGTIWTIAFYKVSLGPIAWSASRSAEYGIALALSSMVAGSLAWFSFGLWYMRLTRPESANSSSYHQLRQHLISLAARLETRDDEASSPLARAEVARYREMIERELNSPGDLRWVFATGYVDLWRALHRAEEGAFLISPREDIIRNGFQDELRLRDSRISDRERLRDQLCAALHALDADICLMPPTGPRTATARATAMRREQKSVPAMPKAPAIDQVKARLLLAGVRRALNEYRDSKYAGLVQARNRAVRTMLVTGFATYGLVAIAAVSDTSRRTLIQATGVFLVGALVGLFSRLYDESRVNAGTTIEDYGLSTVRLLTRPLLSGLAALGGVFITVSLPGTLHDSLAAPSSPPPAITASQPARQAGSASLQPLAQPAAPIETPANPPASMVSTLRLSNVFDIEQHPLDLVVAAVFGLTPGLLFSRLQQQTEDLKADLRASELSGQAGQREHESG
jgi:hypothetical protein